MKMQFKRGYRDLITHGVAILMLVVALLFCILMVNVIDRRMNESALSNLLNTTQVISDTMNGLIQKDYDCLSVVSAVVMSGEIPDTDQLLVLREKMELDWLGIVDEQGNGVDCFGNQYSLSQYSTADEWDMRSKGHSDTFIGRRSGRPQITLWVPMYKDGAYFGAVLGNVILSQYYSANVFTFYEGEGRTYLFSGLDGGWVLKSLGSDGTLVRQEDIYSLLEASGNKEEDVAVFREAVESGNAGSALLNFSGQQSLLCFLPMDSSSNWYVATVIAKDVLLREATEVKRIIVLVLAILGLALALSSVALMVWRMRRAKNREAHYREALFANVSANIDSAFIIYDKKSRKTAFASDNITRLLGLNRAFISEDVGRLFDWCAIPAEDPQRIAFLGGTLQKPAVREVLVGNELGEHARTIRLELIPADLDQELAVLTDITSDKEIQRSLIETMEQAKNASNAKNEFMSAMSHDLRTPIHGIVGMTAIAGAHLDDRNRVFDCLKKISESASHLLSLVNEVLDVSQIDSGKIELSSEPFNVAELLQNVLNINYPGFQQKNHTVKVHIHLMEHEEVIGDPARLTRLATNLISNAIKYTPSGGFIKLTLQEKPRMIQGYGCYELTVRDNGIGMSPEFLPKLFEPFEREKDVQTSRIQGTGLGLSIVKSLVELMMGSIEVESEKGKGTTFRTTINLRLDEREEKMNNLIEGLKVLVVDDDIDACKAVTDILCNIGMDGEWTISGAEAVAMVAEQHRQKADYLAVLLDWKMEKMDGVETARRIRAEAGSKIPIIILTAYDWTAIEVEARKAGVNEFLSKPIYKAKLLQKMTEIADGSYKAADALPTLSERRIPAGRRVLLVEDNALNTEIAVEILRQMGVQTNCVSDGLAAVEHFSACSPGTYDLILMDIQMPKMNGYEATRAIRCMERPDGRTVPIVAMTADAFKKDEQMAFEAGMNEYLTKPISVDRLAQILSRFLSGAANKHEEEQT